MHGIGRAWVYILLSPNVLIFNKENLMGKPKGCFPIFMDDICSKPVNID
jgi:hypothetical protein